MNKAGKSGLFYGYIVVLAGFLIWVGAWGMSSTFGVFFTVLLDEFGWSRAMLSGATALMAVLIGVTGIITGRITDRFGPRRVITAGGLLLLAGYLLLSRFNAVWQFYILYGFFIGVGLGAIVIPVMSTVSRWFVKRRGIVTGITQAGAGIGGIIVVPLAGRLILDYGWRNSYVILGIITTAIIVLATQFIKRDPAQMGLVPYGEGSGDNKEPLALPEEGLSLREAIRTHQFWMVSVIFFCFGYTRSIILIHIVPHVTDMGFSLIVGANIIGVLTGMSTVGRLIFGRLADIIGNRRTLIISFILIAIILGWVAVADQLWMLYVFAAIFGLSWGSLSVMRVSITSEIFGLGSFGVIMGIHEFMSSVGAAGGPFLSGWIFDVTGSYFSAFLISAGIGFIGLIVSWLLKPIGGKGTK
ncbi:MFS transporter [Chloroflexota bacterium]